MSIVDGTVGDELDAVQSGVLDAPPPAPGGGHDGGHGGGDGDVPSIGFSYDSALGRSVLTGLDDGTVV